jgi:hypothetical protein
MSMRLMTMLLFLLVQVNDYSLVPYDKRQSINCLESRAAMNKMMNVLNLKDEQVRSKAVVFISAVEHDENILPWKETQVEVNYFANFI